jgi:hypothetical protein
LAGEWIRIWATTVPRGFERFQERDSEPSLQPRSLNTELQVGTASETVAVSAEAATDYDESRDRRQSKKLAQPAPSMPSQNVLDLQKRVAGVLPIAVDVPHAGTAFHFVRPLVVNEETKVTFTYKSRG